VSRFARPLTSSQCHGDSGTQPAALYLPCPGVRPLPLRCQRHTSSAAVLAVPQGQPTTSLAASWHAPSRTGQPAAALLATQRHPTPHHPLDTRGRSAPTSPLPRALRHPRNRCCTFGSSAVTCTDPLGTDVPPRRISPLNPRARAHSPAHSCWRSGGATEPVAGGSPGGHAHMRRTATATIAPPSPPGLRGALSVCPSVSQMARTLRSASSPFNRHRHRRRPRPRPHRTDRGRAGPGGSRCAAAPTAHTCRPPWPLGRNLACLHRSWPTRWQLRTPRAPTRLHSHRRPHPTPPTPPPPSPYRGAVTTSPEPGAEIHPHHPFAAPDGARDPVRQLRGRLVAPVTVWTSGTSGLTVSSLVVAAGEPASVCALLDPDSDLAEALGDGGRAVVNVLRWRHRTVADVFAGLHPSPGGVFRTGDWVDGPVGPVLADAAAVAVVTVVDRRRVGWSDLVTATVDEVTTSSETDDLLAYARGRYRTVGAAAGG